MAINIDTLNLETQPAAAKPAPPPASAPPPPKTDVKAELDKIRERYLRLQAD